MNWIPNELRLCHGAVFRMRHQFKDEGEKYRYFIVLNQTPSTDKLVVLTTTTTQIERLERVYGAKAESHLIYIHPNDYPDVERFCVVDCRAIHCQEKEELIAAMHERQFEFKALLPDNILAKIIKSISLDKTIPPSIKSLVVGQSE